jgi:hypothetical protein
MGVKRVHSQKNVKEMDQTGLQSVRLCIVGYTYCIQTPVSIPV